ncbi:hypothetical protein PsYK624_061220 [Phanerochaete sordida]|uniref:Uncharacterized protein n=1 Tax=Phanerochaete sordida TaxID=48140 RepID=A0A9P3G8H2_9APHY|nr:hypothetical protein PsYK624_061220 [Phanerochaete sordida]
MSVPTPDLRSRTDYTREPTREQPLHSESKPRRASHDPLVDTWTIDDSHAYRPSDAGLPPRMFREGVSVTQNPVSYAATPESRYSNASPSIARSASSCDYADRVPYQEAISTPARATSAAGGAMAPASDKSSATSAEQRTDDYRPTRRTDRKALTPVPEGRPSTRSGTLATEATRAPMASTREQSVDSTTEGNALGQRRSSSRTPSISPMQRRRSSGSRGPPHGHAPGSDYPDEEGGHVSHDHRSFKKY